jgi:retron-type reverse transcriptase
MKPVVEVLADKNAYGFRPKRSCADAIEQCFKVLCRKSSPNWILEGYIQVCFDKVSHQWLLDNTPMDRNMLEKCLKCGFVELEEFYPTDKGTPQIQDTSTRKRAADKMLFIYSNGILSRFRRIKSYSLSNHLLTSFGLR